ncbi:hypothetical protein C0J52_09747 [Blattella germanica]|nr:hypothetical protein C0J52_09747 [Blattella germanica]
MESVQCPTPPLPEAGPSPKSPPRSSPLPRGSPPFERDKSASPTSERPQSPEPNCAICLGKSQNKSFTDSCLHQFCFTCLLEWSKVKAECPLCKQSFKSIIHNVRSNEEYDQYHLRPAVETRCPWTVVNLMHQRFRYSTTMTADRRLEQALEHLEQDLQRRVDPGDVIPPQRTWRRRRGLAPDEFRVNVYNQNLRVTSLPCMGLLRDVSPQLFRNRPEEVHRLIPWLNRELQAIMRNPSLSARALDLVISQLSRYHMHSSEFRFEMVEDISSDTSDSDVVMLSHMVERQGVPTRSPSRRTQESSSPVPGPSTAILPIDQPSDSEVNVSSDTSFVRDGDGNRRSVDGNDSETCMIVGYVKPRHERTPEIITLSSSDTDVDVVTEVQQVTTMKNNYDHSMEYTFSTSTSSESSESGDSEYIPSSFRKSPKKLQRKKKSSNSKTSKGRSGRKSSSTHSKKRNYLSSVCDSDSSTCVCYNKKSRRRVRSPSISSSSSSSSDATWRKTPRDRKDSWRIRITDVPQNYNCNPPYTPTEINNFVGNSVCPNNRPKLRSIVITRTSNDRKVRSSTSGENRSRRPLKRVKLESSAGPSGTRHRGGSHSSHSSHRHDSSSRHSDRYKRVKKEDKTKKKKRQWKSSNTSAERKSHSKRVKIRKRILSVYSDTSDE